MTVTRYGNNRYEGLTADTKPTNVAVGSIYRDTQTDDVFEFNGTSWDLIIGASEAEIETNKTIDSIYNILKNIGGFKYSIFKDGSTYYCRNNLTGAIEVSNSSPNTVLQYPLTNGGSVYVHSADYTLTAGPTVYFDFPKETIYCDFQMAPDARILVPQGFTGTVFRFKNSTTLHCTGNRLMGGYIREAGTVARDWTAILFEGTGGEIAAKGVFGNIVEYVRIWDAKHGVRYNCDSTSTTGFVTSNYVENMFIYRCKGDFIGFQMDIAYTTSPNINGSHRNRHINILLQSSGLTEEEDCVGVNNIMGRENSFYGVYVADFNHKNRACIIHADSDSTIIDGGSMTLPGNTDHDPPVGGHPRFVDNSTLQNTKIRDMYRHNQIGRITPGIGGNAIEVVPVTGQTTNTISFWDTNKWERFYMQKAATQYLFDFARSHTSGALRPVLFRQYDSTAGGNPVESFRIETDSSLRVNTNKLKLRDSNDSHDITVTVPDIAANYNLAIPAMTANDTLMLHGSGADQDILVRNSSGVFVPLAKGTNNRALTISAGGLVSWNFITNANILAHTSTQITITAKAQLNSQIAYKDETAWLTDSMVESNLLQLIRGPVRGKKVGSYYATASATGFGLLTSLTGIGTGGAVTIDNDYGSYYPRTTGTNAGDAAGFSYINRLTIRKFNPILAMKIRPSVVALNRMYLGWKSNVTSVTALSDDPLANLSGVMFLQKSGDTTWHICSNNGAASSTIVDTTTPISATTPTNLQIRAVNASSKWQWSTDGGVNWTDVTGNFPAETTNLFWVAESQTNEAGVSHGIHFFGVEIVSDM